MEKDSPFRDALQPARPETRWNWSALVRAAVARTGAARGGLLRWRRERRRLAQRLTAFADALAERNARTEADFLALGGCLRKLHAAAAALLRDVEQCVGGFRGTLAEVRVAGPDGVAAAALRELHEGLAEAGRLLTAQQQVGEELMRLEKGMHDIGRVGVILRTAVVGFSVESTRTTDCQAAFGAFVGELRGLSGRISGMIDQMGEHLEATRSVHEAEMRAMVAGLAHLQELSAPMRSSADAAAQATQQAIDSAAAALAQAAELSKQLAAATEEAVFHIQFGDIVRQKIEHIVSAFRQAAGSVAGSATAAGFRREAATAAQTAAVQAAQLELIREEVAGAHRRLGASFESIAAQCDALAGSLAGWRAEGPADPGQGRRKQLEAELLRLDQLLGESRKLQQDARAIASDIARASVRLSGHIGEIKTVNSDMHLQALNAIVKTAVLGDAGATLEVLSMEVDRLYQISSREVTTIITSLEAVAHHGAACTEDRGSAPTTTGGLRGGVELIAAAIAEVERTAGAAAQRIDEQQGALAEGTAHLQFLAVLADNMEGEIASTSALGAELEKWSAGAVADTARALGGDEYTMHSEREIHARITQRAPEKAAPETGPDAGPEFFNTPAPAVAAQVASAATEDKTEIAVLPAPAEPKGHGLGDNVDLF